MNDFQDTQEEVTRQLEQLTERSEQLFVNCRLRTAQRVAKEAIRQARANQRVIPYMYGLFDLMRQGHGLLDPQMTREAAVELIVLLQDEEQARRIQPDLDEAQYQWVCAWMSSCAYDNLAEATGLMAGYNSPGMHECINEGIQVCRQTGKMECIRCFREYAADVYLASDDLMMVRHQCQSLLNFQDNDDQRDRRWSAHQKQGWLNLLEGRISGAESELEKALQLADSEKVYLKKRAKALVIAALDEVRLMSGRSEELITSTLRDEFDTSEWPRLELELAKVEALQRILAKDVDAAIEILTEWDRRLTELRCMKDWFEVRLRLIAAYLINGKRPRAESLAKGLDANALEAQDYLTLERSKRLMANSNTISPIPLLADPDSGPFHSETLSSAAGTTSPTNDDIPEECLENEPVKEDSSDAESSTPLADTLAGYMQQIMAAEEDEEGRRAVLNALLTHDPESVEDAGDAAYLVHLSRYVTLGSEDAARVWDWATGMLKRFPEDSVMLSVVAVLGQFFRTADPETFESIISPQQLEDWIRLSLSLNPNHPRNHARAGAYFLDDGNPGEAEKCFARAFRLDRSDGAVAHQLAELYRETERPRDALAVLEICLRKGTTDANVAWEAAMTSLQLKQYDMLLTCLDHYRELADHEQTWLHYYRGLACFRLGKLEECLQELDEELNFDPPGHLHLHVIRFCALEQAGRTDQARHELEEVLKLRFVDVDYLSLHGLVRLSEALCDAVEDWPEDDPLRQRLVRRLLRAGLISDEFLESMRQRTPESDQVRFFRVQVRQALSSDWPESEGCLTGQQGWKDYLIDWGVLAETEIEAIDRVLDLQNSCEELPAQVVHVEGTEETFRERPGVVWQGYRRNEASQREDME